MKFRSNRENVFWTDGWTLKPALCRLGGALQVDQKCPKIP